MDTHGGDCSSGLGSSVDWGPRWNGVLVGDLPQGAVGGDVG